MARSREIATAFFTICFASFLLITPARGATNEALATVVASQQANIGGQGAPVGTTIFAGDNVTTSDTGSVQVRAGSARFELGVSSAATMNEEAGMPRATLLKGSASFSTANAQAFALNVLKAVIRPQSDEPTIGQVSVLDQRRLLVKSVRGSLTITVGDDSRVIPEGASYRVVLDPTADEEAQSQPPSAGAGGKGMGRPPVSAGQSRFMWYATGAVVLLTAIALHKALESPDRP